MAQPTRTVVRAAAPARATTPGAPSTLGRAKPAPAAGYYQRAWRRFRRNKVALVALVVLVVIVLLIAAAPLISRYVTGFGPNENNLIARMLPPGQDGYLLGSDGNGRDILTRLLYGGRVSLLIAVLATLSTLVIGGTVGAVAGFAGGLLDAVLMRLVDVVISIPGLALLILISSLYRPGPVGLAFVLAATGWTGVARIVRGEVLALRERDYVDAARVLGASNGAILRRHIFPNVVPTLVVWTSIVIPGLILAEAGLSFLGLGVRVPTPSWGNMLQEASETYRQSWTNVFFPGAAIYITVLAINLVGDGLRDALDPRARD